MDPQVSVIVPVFNVGEFLDSTLNSVRRQILRHWELIVVNDGSTDGSLAVAQRHAAQDPRIRVVSQDRSGVSVARNLGLSLAGGDSVIFLDGDDLWLPGSLGALAEKQRQSGSPVVYGQQQHLHRDGSLRRIGSRCPNGDILLDDLKEDFVHIGATLIRRDFLLENRLRFTPHAIRSQDKEFVWKLLATSSVETVPEVVQIRRFRNGSATNSAWSWKADVHSIGCYERTYCYIDDRYPRRDKSQVLHLLKDRIGFLRFRALWKLLKEGNDDAVLHYLGDPAWSKSMRDIELENLNKVQRLEYRLLMQRRARVWRICRRFLN